MTSCRTVIVLVLKWCFPLKLLATANAAPGAISTPYAVGDPSDSFSHSKTFVARVSKAKCSFPCLSLTRRRWSRMDDLLWCSSIVYGGIPIPTAALLATLFMSSMGGPDVTSVLIISCSWGSRTPINSKFVRHYRCRTCKLWIGQDRRRVEACFEPSVEAVIRVRFVEVQIVFDALEVAAHILIRPGRVVKHGCEIVEVASCDCNIVHHGVVNLQKSEQINMYSEGSKIIPSIHQRHAHADT